MNKRSTPARHQRDTHGPRSVTSVAARNVLCTAVLASLAACGSGEAPGAPDEPGQSRPIAAVGDPAAGGTDLDPGSDPGDLGDAGDGGTFDDGYLSLYEALALAAATDTTASPAPSQARPDAPGPAVSGVVPTAGTGDSIRIPTGQGGGSDDPDPSSSPAPAPEPAPAPDPEPAPNPAPEPAPEPAMGAASGNEDGPGPTAMPSGAGGQGSSAPPADPGGASDEIGDSTLGRRFTSRTTAGFEGEVLDDGRVRLEWLPDRTARGYNVYRAAKYVTTVFATDWTDEDTFDGDLYYEIEAFDFVDKFTRIATGLTVPVRGSGRVDPEANLAGTPQLQDYQLVFSDEFEGNRLDLSTWNTSYLWGDDLVINQEEQHYVDVKNEPGFGFDPFEVGGGTLAIKSVPTPPELSQKANGQEYLSGVITSYDAFKFTYGYAEARAKTPFGQGLWSAFWLLNAYYGDDDPEIDIMEHIGDDQDVMYHTYHYYDGDELRSTKSHPVPGIDYTGDFHTYAVDWRPGLLVFYVDGKETHRVSDPRVSDQEMYLIANTALGGWWPGSPDDTTPFPARYEIDYIRVYQKNGPYDDPGFDDDTSYVPYADATLGASPNHRPPFSAWPQGYPTR